VKLSDGQCSGRVEIFYKGQWGTVCDDEWELANADVVCRQLGCGHAVTAPKSAHFGRGTGPIWLDNVECTGDESALTHCTHPGFGENNCGHSEDAGAVLSRMKLEKPSLSLTSPHAMVIYSPEKISVTQGSSFSITCSIHSSYPGGFFYLTESKLNTTVAMPAFGHSIFYLAYFEFQAIDYKNQGEYSCVYGVNISSRSFSSVPSRSLQVTVAGKNQRACESLFVLL
uniref:SRCR domain-containing protein n=1 Tax=Cyclopterus lumpus TaxID=8103 RepID=A0A8C3A5S7_CYCLU